MSIVKELTLISKEDKNLKILSTTGIIGSIVIDIDVYIDINNIDIVILEMRNILNLGNSQYAAHMHLQ